jgi:flagellar biosynthesis/type III secretory pathway protein FliH
LSKKGHSSLRVLSAQVEREDIQNFLTDSEQLNEQGDRENIDAVLQVSVAANTLAYDEIRKEAGNMCEALRELFKDEINQGFIDGEKKGKLEGKLEGRLEGRLETLISLVKDDILTLSEAAQRADMTEALFTEKMTHFRA